MLSIMLCKEARKMAAHLTDMAEPAIVTLISCWYDLELLTNKLTEAARRGVSVRILADSQATLRGPAKKQSERFKQVLDAGAEVACKGRVAGTSGLLHAKAYCCENYAVIGSANWTANSTNNKELSVLLNLSNENLQ